MSVGAVLEEAFDLYTRYFWRFVATAAVAFIVLDLLAAIVDSASGKSTGAYILWALISAVLTVVGAFWVQGALVEAVNDVRDGRIDTTIGELFERTRPRLPALIAAGIVAAIAIAVGLVLLVVPGLFLLTRWALIPAVVVIEKRSAGEAFSRSWELVRGHGWSVFGSLVVAFIAAAIGHGILTAVFYALPRFASVWIGGVIADSLTTPFVALVGAVMYFRLARLSVGLDPVATPEAVAQ
jgi:Membrane domain of glycerophosphoryl diester phosphodiesterase